MERNCDVIVKIFRISVLWSSFIIRIYFWNVRSVPVNIVARRTLLWVDARLNTYCGNWRCNIATEVAAFRFRTVLHTRSGRHNCPCPSYTVQNPRKTNTTVCEVPGPVHASEMRVNELAWLCYVVLYERAYSNTSTTVAWREVGSSISK